MQIRQSLKAVLFGYVLCLAAEVAIAIYWIAENPEGFVLALLALPPILAVFVAIRHIQRRTTKITILDGRLRYESGLFSKTTRTMELVKVQDVRVDQTLGQRLFNVGDVSLETAGESSRIVMRSIDRPQQAADKILELAHGAGKGQSA